MTNGRQVVRYVSDVLEVLRRDDAYTPLGLPPVVVLGLAVVIAGASVVILALSVFLLATIGLALAVLIFRFGRHPRTRAAHHTRRSAGWIPLGPHRSTSRPMKTRASACGCQGYRAGRWRRQRVRRHG